MIIDSWTRLIDTDLRTTYCLPNPHRFVALKIFCSLDSTLPIISAQLYCLIIQYALFKGYRSNLGSSAKQVIHMNQMAELSVTWELHDVTAVDGEPVESKEPVDSKEHLYSIVQRLQ